MPFPSPRPVPLLLAGALGTACLCAAALINGGPVMYPDTLNYLADGHGLIRLTTPDNTRPVFYGLAIELLHWERSAWPVIVAQAAIVAHLLYLTARTVAGPVRPMPLLAGLALLAVATPVSWYVAHLLPDLFSGVLILAVFLLVFAADRLSPGERLYVFLLATASIGFHLTNLVTGAALCGGAWLAFLLWRFGRPVWPTLALGLALAALLTSSFALYGRLSVSPKSPPHFMARLIADGPGRAFLEQACPERHFFVCPDLDRLPRTENGILWRYMASLGDADGRRFRADAGAIVAGTLQTFPAQVAAHMLGNTLRQFVTVDSGTEMDAYWWQHFTQPPFMVRAVTGTLQQRGLLDRWFPLFNLVDAAVVVASAVACLVLSVRTPNRRAHFLCATILLGLVANAFAAGALGGVFGRYGGRVVWLVPAAALILGWAAFRSSPSLTEPRRAATSPGP